MTNRIAVTVLALTGTALLAQQITFQKELSSPFKAPVAVVAGDFNGDGKMDIAVADALANTITVMLGKGDGTFLAGTNYAPSNCTPTMLAMGDFNGDGRADLLTFCEPSDMYAVLPGRPDGTFGAAVYTGNGTVPLSATYLWTAMGSAMAIADLNGDGKLDIAVATVDAHSMRTLSLRDMTYGGASHEQLTVMLGRGDGSFEAPTTVNMGSTNVIAVTAGDFNGDGQPDLAVSYVDVVTGHTLPHAYLALLMNNGSGTFTAGTTVTIDMLAPNLRVADLNGDGKADIVLSGPPMTVFETQKPSSEVRALLGDGMGNLTQTYSAAISGYDAVGCYLADVRGTGNLDIVEAQVAWAPGIGVSISVLAGQMVFRPGTGDGTFQNAVTLPLGDDMLATAVVGGDFDGDGRYDLAILHVSATETAKAYESVQSATQALAALETLTTGTLDLMLNSTPPITFTTVNGASFAKGAQAAASIVSAFGVALAPGTASPASLPLPVTLGGVSINVVDSAGQSRPAPLFYVSPRQVNFEIPEGTAAGQATASINYGSVSVSQKLDITTVAPGVFNANGLAVGNVVSVMGGQQQIIPLVQLDATNTLVPVPIDLDAASQVFLVLYGTGIRSHAAAVTAAIGSATATATYAGPQGVYVGEDQINIQVPSTLKGAGLVDVSLTVDGKQSNAVKVQLK